MSKNISNIRVYGDDETAVWLAPVGSVLPETLDMPTLPFDEAGWISEDGTELEVSADVAKFKAGQGGATVRTKVTGTEKSIKVQFLEESPLTTALYFGHGEVEISGEGTGQKVARYDLPEALPTVERAAIFVFHDGDTKKFLCAPLVQVTDRGSLVHKTSEMTIYEVTLEIIGDSYILTNSAAYTE